MPRLFTALEIPREAALSLSLLRGGLPGARWLSVENYHITLRFIGDIDGPTADELIGAFDRIDRQAFRSPFPGWVPSARRNRIRSGPAFHPPPSSRRCRPRSNGSASAMACRRIRGVFRRTSRSHGCAMQGSDVVSYLGGRGDFPHPALRCRALRGDVGAGFRRRRALSGRGSLSAGLAQFRAEPRHKLGQPSRSN
jgi:hypothetical protein